ncbi:histidine kinase [soil metagenome]
MPRSGRFRIRSARHLLGDAAVAAALCAYSVAELLLGSDGQSLALHLVTTAIMTLPLAVRRTNPLVTAVAFASGLLLGSVATTPVPLFGEFVAGLLAAYSLAVHASRRAVAVGGGCLAFAVLVFVARDPSGGFLPLGLETLLPFGVAVGIGAFARRRRNEARDGARRAADEERTRIARELHDLVGHAVSLMTVQAGVARVALDADDGDRARSALASVEGTGREALDELRRLLGILRAHDHAADDLAPQPGLDAIAGLVEQLRGTGREADLRVEGAPRPIPAGMALTAYRIVQEALTNVVKHAGEARVAVVVRYADDRLEVEITDDGSGAGRRSSGGHGLAGMRERAALYGGEVRAGSVPDGGFRVLTRLPVPGAVS